MRLLAIIISLLLTSPAQSDPTQSIDATWSRFVEACSAALTNPQEYIDMRPPNSVITVTPDETITWVMAEGDGYEELAQFVALHDAAVRACKITAVGSYTFDSNAMNAAFNEFISSVVGVTVTGGLVFGELERAPLPADTPPEVALMMSPEVFHYFVQGWSETTDIPASVIIQGGYYTIETLNPSAEVAP